MKFPKLKQLRIDPYQKPEKMEEEIPYSKGPIQITNRIYISNAAVAQDSAALEKAGIALVVNCAAEVVNSVFEGQKNIRRMSSPAPEQLSSSDVAKPAIQYLKLFWGHNTDISKDLGNIINRIQGFLAENPNGNVLINCQLGICRSASLVISCVMKIFRKKLNEAYDFVKEKNPHICPNVWFMGELAEFEFEQCI